MESSLPEGAVQRDGWNAVPPRVIDFGTMHPVSHIHLTYTGTPPCTTTDECTKAVKDIQTAHMAEPLPDIKHNFLIGGDGRTYVGRGWVNDPHLSEKYADKNGSIFSIAYIGQRGSTPSSADKDALSKLITKGQSLQFIVQNPTYHEEY